MAVAASILPKDARRTALLVMQPSGAPSLCPFFGKCDGVLFIDPDTGSRDFRANTQRTTEAVCDLILRSGVDRLVLGFIGGPAAQKLRAAGVDVRLGSCACAVEDLVARFHDLPAV